MGLGQFFKSIFGKKQKHFESPDVTFIEEDATGVTHTIPITVSAPAQQIIIKNNDEYLVYSSKNDIPKELLNEIEHLDDLGTVDSYSVIVDGQRQIFNKYEDIPEEVRKAISDLEES
jgi:hypothetical protein